VLSGIDGRRAVETGGHLFSGKECQRATVTGRHGKRPRARKIPIPTRDDFLRDELDQRGEQFRRGRPLWSSAVPGTINNDRPIVR
jgi:hypothetical protein